MRGAGLALYWVLPSVVLFWLHQDSLHCWFKQDDFAWLGLRDQIVDWNSFLRVMFAPMAQGTIRTLSERAYFVLFTSLFGFNGFAFHLWVFATASANLVLLSWIVKRITASWLSGFLAPLLWVLNSAIVTALAWSSSYNQMLCGFFILSALALWIHFTDTGRRRLYIAMWIAFLIGFGALELNVVFPAIAALHALLFARRKLGWTLPLFAVSAAYTLLHNYVAPKQSEGVYGMHFDSSIFTTLLTYWQWVLGPYRLIDIREMPAWFAPRLTWALTVAVLAVIVAGLVRRRYGALFFAGCFLLLIAPVLPLRDHVSQYYLTLPSFAVAAVFAAGCAEVLRAPLPARALMAGAVAVYILTHAPVSRVQGRWHFDRSNDVRKLIEGVRAARALHPAKIILLEGVEHQLFWMGVYDSPFRLFNIDRVYLTPGTDSRILGFPRTATTYVLPPRVVVRSLLKEEAVVYDVTGPRLRNITPAFGREALLKWSTELPARVDIGDPLFEDQLGPEWYAAEAGYRWMPKAGTIRLGGPKHPGAKLHVAAFCADVQLAGGPLSLMVSVDGKHVGTARITRAGDRLDFYFPIPPSFAGRESIEVRLEVDRTYRAPSEGRDLGLAFGVVEIL
jgi:hypothetical protein